MFKKNTFKNIVLTGLLAAFSVSLMAESIDNELIKQTNNPIQPTSLEKGKQLWQQKFIGKKPYVERSCTSCHGAKVKLVGKHIKTNKEIKPMAVSINPLRFTKKSKVDKWFFRNCKWTMGRECTQQEKNDITAYLKSQ
tara:strand:+ start:76 stop:489 length:414 start_codon:yes stop_codon:yes gene_type:complete